jgi:four helix bundle protein
MSTFARSLRELEVYKTALQAAAFVSRIVRRYPSYERALADQTRRSGRAAGAAVSEAWPKRFYPAVWKNKLSDAQSEACETQWWLEIAYAEGYCTEKEFLEGFDIFEKLISQLAKMIGNTKAWTLPKR